MDGWTDCHNQTVGDELWDKERDLCWHEEQSNRIRWALSDVTVKSKRTSHIHKATKLPSTDEEIVCFGRFLKGLTESFLLLSSA